MGYQALLFCPDEKLASVVSQVFSELDFTVEAVHEPFAAVKKLMSQRYDAIVVDSENEQNASLLFKSARNSGSNQSALAIALVEGQMGVAKAYRFGANLVLTKPINVEQAKGTLRVARGLLRKNSDAAAGSGGAAPAMPARTAPASVTTGNSFPPANRGAAAMAPPSNHREDHELEAPLPAVIPADSPDEFQDQFQDEFKGMTAAAEVEDRPAVVPAPAAQTQITIAAVPPVEARPSTQSTNPAFWSVPGSAAAPAPAKEVPSPAKQNRIVESDPASPLRDAAYDTAPVPEFSLGSVSDAPSFAALNDEDSEGSGGKKKLLIAAAVLALAALGYFGYGKLAKPSTTASAPPLLSTPQDLGKPTPVPAHESSSVDAPSKNPPGRPSSATQPSVSKATTAVPSGNPGLSTSADNSPVIRIAANPEAEAKKSDSAPLVVKSTATRTRAQAQAQDKDQESAPALPTPPALAAASDSKVNGLMDSVSSNVAKPALATLRVSQGVSQGLLIKRVTPKYPQAALAVHAQGEVQIEATITKEGNVINPKVLRGDPVLAQAAVEAVRQWRYKPYYLDGTPVEIQTQITINFKAN
jgi:TonB family protein